MAAEEKVALEGGTYEILKNRLAGHAKDLRARLEELNAERKRAFGSIELSLLDSQRVTTANNCIPRDLVCVGDKFLFGYNVQFGLKTSVQLSDVFTIYEFRDGRFTENGLDLIQDKQFIEDFTRLYRYFTKSFFSRFVIIGPHLYMVFQVGREVTDVKVFKWTLDGDRLIYLDNRSEHEYRFPSQHEFNWVRAHRDMHRTGLHPHVSIEDRVFVEAVGGDLTIKIEDNTDSGEGIYAEPVQEKDQTLDDAEILYAIVNPLILLKVRPYQEPSFRYFVFNDKLKTVHRIDAIENACVLLPDSHGIIFSRGYCLHTGEVKVFDNNPGDMMFERRIAAPNGEDHLFVFYNRESGVQGLLSYNIISQQVETPILCHGFSFFDDGRMLLVGGEPEPQKHHTVQVWRTPYTSLDFATPKSAESPLQKIGNRAVVRCMAECHEVLKLIDREEAYELVYTDIAKKAGDIVDTYFWIGNGVANLKEDLSRIRTAASGAVEEFRKVVRVRKHTREQMTAVSRKVQDLLQDIASRGMDNVERYVGALGDLRNLRGEIISLRELRYIEAEKVGALENRVVERSESLAGECTEFLLKPAALGPYQDRLGTIGNDIDSASKGVDARAATARIDEVARELDLLIEIVSNLRIDDPTKSSAIIDRISAVYAALNQLRESARRKVKSLMSSEAVEDFAAQIKLLDQGVISFLDISDSPVACDEHLNKLLVQIEGLEGRFADFDEFVLRLAEKREEVQAAFETRRLALVESRNRKAATLEAAAMRILKGIATRAGKLDSVDEINGYLASDLMVAKVHDVITQLKELDDSAKAEGIASQLKSIREDVLRRLKDRQDLFSEGGNVIRLGRHQFTVNTQPLDVTIVRRDDRMYCHLTGTGFFEQVDDPALSESKAIWNQEVISEDATVYRGEFLAWQLLKEIGKSLPGAGELLRLDAEALLATVRSFAGPRFLEGYIKGVHDQDAALILRALLGFLDGCGLLRYRSRARALATLYWQTALTEESRSLLRARIAGLGALRKALGRSNERDASIRELASGLEILRDGLPEFGPDDSREASEYLFEQLAQGGPFVVGSDAIRMRDEFFHHLELNGMKQAFTATLNGLGDSQVIRFDMALAWVRGFEEATSTRGQRVEEEVALLLIGDQPDAAAIEHGETRGLVEGLTGSHDRIVDGALDVDLPEFLHRLRSFEERVVPLFARFNAAKRRLVESFREELRLEEFVARPLSSFVRNRLIDSVYLPLIGENLAKQIGTVGAEKRTDLMGMLLLISPPGYGKTTLMEYLASRLGLVFVKINGPALGHRVISLDPTEAPNASARQELLKLAVAFEMGDNVMIYVDDIQHCNSEFLQRFISLCDAQRKIEGVYKGRSKTYDFRGRRVCIIMAGNPFTESGEVFRLPDMLANRADTYNLGDIIGDHRPAFELSYIENALTSNPILSRLANRSMEDVHAMIRLADSGNREGLDFEADHSAEEINEYVSVLRKLRTVQAIILNVNKAYIQSAAQSEEYRTEPPFRLQGSYRNMNRLAEKVLPVMDEAELKTLILSHYEGESQTLAANAEANLLKFKEIVGWLSGSDEARLADIRDVFRRNNKFRGLGGDNAMSRLLLQMDELNQGVRDSMGRGVGEIAQTRAALQTSLAQLAQPRESMPRELTTSVSADSMARMTALFDRLRLALAANRPVIVTTRGAGTPADAEVAEDLDTIAGWLEEEEYIIRRQAGALIAHCGDDQPIELRAGDGRVHFRAEAGRVPVALSRSIYRELLVLNTQILPVSIGLERSDAGHHRLLVLESRDMSQLGRPEFLGVMRSFQSAVEAAAGVLEGLLAQGEQEEQS